MTGAGSGPPPLPAELTAELPGPVVRAEPLSGGMIADVWSLELSDGSRIVVKATSYDARLEADGLQALDAAGGPVPQVRWVDPELLVLDHVSGSGDPATLGAAVATVHRDVSDRFGWHQDNVIGPLPQRNPWTADWVTFYADHRLALYLDDLPVAVGDRLRAAIDDGRLARRLDHDVAPSLIHGDLWHGNVIGERWLIDPAVSRSDRELDLAMLALFGSVSSAFLGGYEDVWPLDDGWQERRPALQLYHLLVHVRLFGSGYVASVRQRLDQLGW